jgi:Protein of unknown function (DUF1214)
MVINGIFRTRTGCPWRDDQIPPTSRFWSVTMYDTPNFLLVANPIGRYSIGDRTPGLAHRRRRVAHDLHATGRAFQP